MCATGMPLPKRLTLSLVETGAGRTTKDYESDQNIFVQGEVANSVFFIQQGRVKVSVTSDQGKDAVIGILSERQFFGEGCLHGQPLRLATTKALCHCRISHSTSSGAARSLPGESITLSVTEAGRERAAGSAINQESEGDRIHCRDGRGIPALVLRNRIRAARPCVRLAARKFDPDDQVSLIHFQFVRGG
jgi:hypothetical protein